MLTLYNLSNKQILSKPVKKVVDNNMIVGIITHTNQFVPITPERYREEPEEIDDLKVEYTENINNQLNLDQELLLDKAIDTERLIITKKIKLENNFYNLFRNTLKILLNYNENKQIKQNIYDILNNISINYIEKVKYIRQQIHVLLDPVIKFQEIELSTIDDFDNLINCLGLNKDRCDKQNHCFMRTENGVCKFIIPERNLFNNLSNEKLYFNKISDELVRYSKIRKFILTPKTFLSFSKVNYNISDKEIILLEEILLDRYLENIKLRVRHDYIKNYNIYDTTNPNIEYSMRKINLTDNNELIINSNCIVETNIKVGKYIYNIVFSEDLEESNFTFEQLRNTPFCSVNIVKSILENYKKETFSIQSIKTILYRKYAELTTPENELVPIRNQQGSNWSVFSLMNWYAYQKEPVENIYIQFQDKKNNEIQKQIFMENYFFTIFDLFILFTHFKVPVILKMVSAQSFQTNASMNYFSTVTSEDTSFYCILVNKRKKKTNNDYGIVKYNDSYKIPIEIINNTKINFIDNNLSIENFLKKSIEYLEKRQRINRKNDLRAKHRRRGKVVKLTTKKKLTTAKTTTAAKATTAAKSKTPSLSPIESKTAVKSRRSKSPTRRSKSPH